MTDSRLSASVRERWIVDMLRDRGPMTPAEIAEQLAFTVDHARVVLRQMRARGVVRCMAGRWEREMRGRPPTRYEVAG